MIHSTIYGKNHHPATTATDPTTNLFILPWRSWMLASIFFKWQFIASYFFSSSLILSIQIIRFSSYRRWSLALSFLTALSFSLSRNRFLTFKQRFSRAWRHTSWYRVCSRRADSNSRTQARSVASALFLSTLRRLMPTACAALQLPRHFQPQIIYIQIRNSIVRPINRTISREILTVISHVTANILLKRTNKLLVTLSYNWHKSSLSTRDCSGTTELYLVSSLETTQIRSSLPVMHTNNSCGLLPSAPYRSTELTSSWRTYTRTRIPRIRSVFLNLDSRHWVFYNLETRLGFLILHCVSNTFLTQCYANRVPRSP